MSILDRVPSEPSAVLDAVLDAAEAQAIIVLDEGGRVTGWARGARRIHGYEANEMVGRSTSFLHADEDAARGDHERKLEVALDRGRYDGECWQTRRDGSRFWASLAVVPIENDEGELLGFVQATHGVDGPGASQRAGPDGAVAPAWPRHDGAVQAVFQAGMRLQALTSAGTDVETARQLEMVADDLDLAIQELRSLVLGVGAHAPSLAESGAP